MYRKIKKITDLDGLCDAICQCVGRVEAHTDEGDILNLRSELSRLVTVNLLLSEMMKLENIRFFIEYDEDIERIKDFVIFE